MMPSVPRQGRRCTVYGWCAGHVSGAETEHRSRVHAVPARDGRELRFTLTATRDGPPRVDVEVVLDRSGPSLDVAELELPEVLHAAAALRRLALEGSESVNDSS